jgi:predicted GTPase
VPSGGLPADLAEQATFVAHARPELRQKVIVDTPDLDTFYTEHRDATRALLKAAGLVIYVFSPERYVEERAWSVIRQEQRFSACLAVLNKSDTVSPEVLQRIAGEIRQRFSETGKPDIPVL